MAGNKPPQQQKKKITEVITIDKIPASKWSKKK